jgi:hypothetical protein
MDDSTVPSNFPPDPAPDRSLPSQPFHGESLPLQPPPPFSSFYAMTFGQTLERILHLLRAHWKPFLGIGLLPVGFLFAFQSLFFFATYLAGAFAHPNPRLNTPVLLWTVLPAGLLLLPVLLLVYGLYYGASTYASLQADHGLKITVGEALGHSWSRIGRYLWLTLLRGLIIAIPMFVILLIFLIASPFLVLGHSVTANPALVFLLVPIGALLFLGGLVYSIYISLRLSLAFSACVQENLTARQSITLSGALTRGAKGRIFLVVLVIYAISYVCLMAAYTLMGILIFAVGAFANLGDLQHASPLAIAMIALASLFSLAVFFLWMGLLLPAYSIAFARPLPRSVPTQKPSCLGALLSPVSRRSLSPDRAGRRTRCAPGARPSPIAPSHSFIHHPLLL